MVKVEIGFRCFGGTEIDFMRTCGLMTGICARLPIDGVLNRSVNEDEVVRKLGIN